MPFSVRQRDKVEGGKGTRKGPLAITIHRAALVAGPMADLRLGPSLPHIFISERVRMDLTNAAWRKSTRSIVTSNCVEFAEFEAAVAVRDSKAPSDGVITFGPGAWTAFVAGVRAGAFEGNS